MQLRSLLVIAAWAALASCATTDLPPIGAAGAQFQSEKDEKQVWRDAEEIERRIAKSDLLYADSGLEAYLNEIAGRLIAQQGLAPGLAPRIKVILHPSLNAFALPNGAIYFHSGILARMENEAQLAAVLGHELTHYTHRHSLKGMRSAQNQRLLQAVITIGATAMGVPDLGSELGQLWALAALSGYSREMETEADVVGLRALVQAGYDPNEAPKIFQFLRQQLDELGIKEPYFFATHPRLQERIDNYSGLIASAYAAQGKEEGRLKNSAEFLRAIEELLLANATLDLNIGRYKAARAAIERHMTGRPQSPRAHYLLGEVYRRSAQDEVHTRRAIASYEEAARLDPAYAEPHRELGLLYRSQNRRDEARIEFERYLALAPTAVDARIIQGFLAELRQP